MQFERGTISYMITAFLTRPTTMSPVMTCDRKVYFVERIDISPLYPPQPRTITLEPLSKRSRAKHQARKLVDPIERRSQKAASTTPSEQTGQNTVSSATSTATDAESRLGQAPSVISSDSGVSNQGGTSIPDSGSGLTPSDSDLAKSSLSNKTITATVESLTAGCLRGDCIAIRVYINHTKPIRSLYGAIVTLYRQARVDMHPAIPLGPTEKGKEDRHEDYYPKSITGLGGLSLSGAGSSHVFRKDLAQVMVPLYVDPTNLTAEVNAKVRVPEEAFPTISTVPGAMISFKYYTEVVLDVQGKFGGADLSMGSVGGAPGGPRKSDHDGAIPPSAFSAAGSTIIDTTPIRRDKGVVSCTFEVVVGTRDSDRRKGKKRAEPIPEAEQRSVPADPGASAHQPNVAEQSHQEYHQPEAEQNSHWYQHQQPPPEPYPYPQSPAYAHLGPRYGNAAYEEHLLPLPIPQLPDGTQLSEKDRLRIAEARLLPSQPPDVAGSSRQPAEPDATAPYLPDEYSSITAMQNVGSDEFAVPDACAGAAREQSLQQTATVPEYQPPGPDERPSTQQHASGDDKQEMQRRRLELESSAPPRDNEDNVGPPLPAPSLEAPSAPTLDQVNGGSSAGVDYDSHADAAASSGLPRYER